MQDWLLTSILTPLTFGSYLYTKIATKNMATKDDMKELKDSIDMILKHLLDKKE